MDALMPFTRGDHAARRLCHGGTPAGRACLLKVDLLPPEEHRGVLDYVVRQIETLSLAPEIVETAVAGDQRGRDRGLAGSDPGADRRHRSRTDTASSASGELLLEILEGIALASHAVVDRSREATAERAAEASRGRRRLGIRAEPGLDAGLRAGAEPAAATPRRSTARPSSSATPRSRSGEPLLSSSEDQRRAPVGGRETCRSACSASCGRLAGQLSAMMTRQSAVDVRWLQEDSIAGSAIPWWRGRRAGDLPRGGRPGAAPLVNLANMQVLRVISRVGIAGTILLICNEHRREPGTAGLGGVDHGGERAGGARRRARSRNA